MRCYVELHHHRPAYRRGDTEDETVIESVTHFKTKKDAEAFIVSEIKRKFGNYKVKKSKNYYYIYTGKHWQNENTGDDHEETYVYIMCK